MTPGDPPAQPPRRGLSTGRLEALSDGVFAIAITLLVLDIALPAHAGRDLLGAVAQQWPAYLAYAVSFSTIGALWLGHNVITEYLDRADAAFVRLNLLLLFLVALLPFPTRLFADYLNDEQPERVASTIYGLSLLVASTLLWVLWRYAVHAHLVRPDMADEEVEFLTQPPPPGGASCGEEEGRGTGRPGPEQPRTHVQGSPDAGLVQVSGPVQATGLIEVAGLVEVAGERVPGP